MRKGRQKSLKNNVLELILKAENSYHETVKIAVKESEEYADERRKEQLVYSKSLEHEWSVYEKSENQKLERALIDDKVQLERETEETKEQLRDLQRLKLEIISDRLKEEVLSLHGNN